MAGINKHYRLTADGSQVKREFGEVGQAGERMEGRIRQGAAAMSPALRALDAAAGEFKGKLEGTAGAAGGFGNVLRAIGPAGLVAAGGIGALILGFNSLNTASRAATDTLGEIYTAAQRVNTSVEFLQEWRYAMVQTGEDARVVDATLSRFAVKLGQLTTSAAGELRAKLSAYGFSEDDIANMRTVEGALPIIADRIRDLGTAAEDAALLEALGLKELQPLLQQGSAAIDNLRQQARDLGIVLDEETVRRAYDLGGAWDAAAYALDITFKQAMIDAAPIFIETLKFLRDMAQAAGDVADNFEAVETRSVRTLNRQLSELQREQVRLVQQHGGYVMEGGDAARGVEAGVLLAQPGFLRGGRSARELAADRYASLAAQSREIALRLQNIEDSRRLPGEPGGAIDPVTAPRTPDPRLAQAEAMIERIREETRAREALARLQAEFPNEAEQEIQARLALVEVHRQLNEARQLGKIASDEELQALRNAAQANYEAASAAREHAAAIAQRNALNTETATFRRSLETPEERLAREEREVRDLYRRSQSSDNPVTDDELQRRLRAIREEYDKLAEAQGEASLQGQILRGIIDGQIRSFKDLGRVLVEMAANEVIRELLRSLGNRGEGGSGSGGFSWGNVVRGVLEGFGGGFGFGGGRASGGPLYRGLRHPVTEGGKAELLLLGGNAQVFNNETLEGIVALGRRAQRAANAPASAGPTAVTVNLRNESGAQIEVSNASARTNSDGALELELVLGQHVAAAIGAGRADQAMKRFNVRGPRKRRG